MRRAVAALVLCLYGAGSPGAAQEFTTFKGHGGPVMDIAVAPTGQVASASFDNSVGIWSGQEPRWREGHRAAVNVVRPFGEGTWLSGGDDFALWLWEGETGTELGRHKGKIRDIAVAPDGKTVATASWDGSIGLWIIVKSGDPAGWNAIRTDLQGHGNGVNAVAFSADGQRLYSASSDGTIRVWEEGGAHSRELLSNGFAINELVSVRVEASHAKSTS